VDAWTSLRAAALEAGDGNRAYVLKILQNSFYGVLGSPGCAWADDLLSGAITGFGQEILRAARDWFVARGYEVLYGDTDSLFVRVAGMAAHEKADATETAVGVESAGAAAGLEAGAAASEAGAATALALRLAEEASAALGSFVAERWCVDSRLDLRFDKYYERFLIPRIRGDRSARLREELERSGASWLADNLPGPKGRAKGYAGLLIRPDGSRTVDVKGLEAARGDWTPLARRFQLELLDIAFRPAPPQELEAAARAYARELASELRSGGLDGELAFRRVLKRDLERYAADAPHVKAARLSGASSRGDVVEYIQTAAGPEPLGGAAGRGAAGRPDYAWYLERQLGPIWESIAEAAGWEADLSRVAGEQGELF
jgi:DNA polymerase-2